MDIRFCNHYIGNGNPPSNQYCRFCSNSKFVCDRLWQCVINLSKINMGNAVALSGTNAVLVPNPNNHNLVYLRVNAQWSLSKEDFLHFIATGNAKMGRADDRQDPEVSPSLTRQEPYVQAIVEMIGGWNLPEIIAVKNFQRNTTKIQNNVISIREEIIQTLENEKNKLFGFGSPEILFKISIIKQLIKMVRGGKSKYAMIDWLNKKSRTSGVDVKPMVMEVYLMIKDFQF